MAISIETGTSSTSGTGVTTLAWSHTVGSGANFLIVTIGFGDANLSERTASSVTFGAQNLTKLSDADDANWVSAEIWYLANPTVSTNTITVTCSSSDQVGAGAANFGGVDTTTPWGTPVTASGSSTTATVNVTSVNSGEWTIGAIGSDSETGITESGTLIWEIENIWSDTSAGAQYKTTTGTVTMSWTQANTGWAVLAVALKPSGGGGGPSTVTWVGYIG
jgi:hypothetical protein